MLMQSNDTEEVPIEEMPINNIEGSDNELTQFDAAEIENIEELTEDEILSAVESLLFATDKPQSVAMLKSAFQGTKVRSAHIREALEKLTLEYNSSNRGVTLEEIVGGFQLRTKVANQKFLQNLVKTRPFRLSGPALEVLSIVAYRQPCTKAAVDEIRGVESGHLMRALMDKGLLHFAGKSELPGRPMLYETTRRFLEIFNLRNINELPSLSEIDQLIPEGIGETVEEEKTLAGLTTELSSEVVAKSYSTGEEELTDISSELNTIHTTTEYFEQEKLRQKEKREADKAQDIQERLAVGEPVDEKELKWFNSSKFSQQP
ncbi:MAG: SMC-Scp complex subunit ScpB [Bdellovibrionales bacterium RBG_16_40_8]|nr:MAG: SMC-Scp complex subunit ScpB [Bdellovibrionales bacterium RBG_16_40_8]